MHADRPQAVRLFFLKVSTREKEEDEGKKRGRQGGSPGGQLALAARIVLF